MWSLENCKTQKRVCWEISKLSKLSQAGEKALSVKCVLGKYKDLHSDIFSNTWSWGSCVHSLAQHWEGENRLTEQSAEAVMSLQVQWYTLSQNPRSRTIGEYTRFWPPHTYLNTHVFKTYTNVYRFIYHPHTHMRESEFIYMLIFKLIILI